MHVQLLIADLLLPGASLPRLEALELLLARGRRSLQAGTEQEHWLSGRFGIESTDEDGAAAASLLADGGDPGEACWIRADPVHLRVDRDALVLADGAVFSLNEDEAQALAATLNNHFGSDLSIEVQHPERWYCRLATPPRIRCTPLAEARGLPIGEHLPTGPEGMRWHALMNEVQMALHEHPVNAAREARGELPVNSVWFWGNGALPKTAAAPAQRPHNQVLSNDPLARGLAIASGGIGAPLPPGANAWLQGAPKEGTALVVLDALRAGARYGDREGWQSAAEALERDWIAPLVQALRSGHIGMLTCHLIGAEQSLSVETVKNDLRRFWRRVKPLADYAPIEQ